MKCLNRVEMQEYIDSEITPALGTEINDHLRTCEKCKTLYKQALEDKELINTLLNNTGFHDSGESIPSFIPPVERTRRKIHLQIIEVLAAASIIGLVFLLSPGKMKMAENIPQAEILMYEFYDGKDLNKLWHENSQIIILQDEKGNIIEPIITY